MAFRPNDGLVDYPYPKGTFKKIGSFEAQGYPRFSLLNHLENTILNWISVSQNQQPGKIDPQPDAFANLAEISNCLIRQDQVLLFSLIFDQLKDVAGYDSAAIARLTDNRLTILDYRGPDPAELVIGQHLSLVELQSHQSLFHSREPVLITEFQYDSGLVQALAKFSGPQQGTSGAPPRSILVIPLVFKDELTGGVFLCSRQTIHYGIQQLELIQALANFVALSLGVSQICQQARQTAVTEERNRLAGELHDNVAQTLGYLNMTIAATDTLLSNGQVAEAQANLRELKQMVGEAYTDVREEIFNLRAKVSSGLEFLDMLHRYIVKYKKYYDLDIHLLIDVEEFLLAFPTEVGKQVIRIIQEALINVRKHANVKEAHLHFSQAGDRIRIGIEDSGQGFELGQCRSSEKGGFGLQIMQERAESIGGELRIASLPGKGTQVLVFVPRPSVD